MAFHVASSTSVAVWGEFNVMVISWPTVTLMLSGWKEKPVCTMVCAVSAGTAAQAIESVKVLFMVERLG